MSASPTTPASKPVMLIYGLEWHTSQSDAVAEILVRPLEPWLDIQFIPWDGKTPPALPPPDVPVCFFEFAPPCQDYHWRNRELTWIPMWDHTCIQHPLEQWWKSLPEKWRVLSFCAAVDRLAACAPEREVLSVRYHRDPQGVKPVDWSGQRTLYYWNRIGLVGPRFLEKLCSALEIETLLFRETLDPQIEAARFYSLPSNLGKTVVQRVPFYKDKAAYLEHVGSATFLLAPRALEGVGMVMVDALARGCAVLAADLPTANEYINHAQTGALITVGPTSGVGAGDDLVAWYRNRKNFLLSDRQNWQYLAHLDWPRMGQCARARASEISTAWQEKLSAMAEFLGREPQPRDKQEILHQTEAIEVNAPPLISVCVPHLNSMPYAPARLESIRAQTWKNWECIVVDSGSTDGSLELYQRAAREDSRIHLYPVPREGIYPAFNAAIHRARGEYVYIATADDTLQPEGLQIMVENLAKHTGCGACHTPIVLINENGERLSNQILPPNKFFHNWFDIAHIRHHPHDALLFTMVECMYTSVTQMLYRMDAVRRVGEFSSDYGTVGDFAWHMRLTTLFDVLHVPIAVATWRRHDQQASQVRSPIEHLRLLNRVVNDNLDFLMQENPGLSARISRDDLENGYRLQAFCRQVRRAPKYWRRIISLTSSVCADPGILRIAHRCDWSDILNPVVDPIAQSKSLIERLDPSRRVSVA